MLHHIFQNLLTADSEARLVLNMIQLEVQWQKKKKNHRLISERGF